MGKWNASKFRFSSRQNKRQRTVIISTQNTYWYAILVVLWLAVLSQDRFVVFIQGGVFGQIDKQRLAISIDHFTGRLLRRRRFTREKPAIFRSPGVMLLFLLALVRTSSQFFVGDV